MNETPISVIDVNLPFIPSNTVIIKDKISRLTTEQIYSILRYVDVTFPIFDYENLDNIISMCILLVNKIKNNSVILCPGDSPYKISYLMDYIFREGRWPWIPYIYTSSTTVGANTFSYIQKKNIKFVPFPISKVSEIKLDPSKLDEYLWSLDLYSSIANGSNIGIMDYSDSGSSIKILSKSIKRTYGINTVDVYELFNIYSEALNGKDLDDNNRRSFFFNIISEAEKTDCRCQYRYVIGKEDDNVNQNKYRCNMMIALLYLRFLDRLPKDYQWLPRVDKDLVNYYRSKVCEIIYYDTETLDINSIIGTPNAENVHTIIIDSNNVEHEILTNCIYSISTI
ncbi:Hypothetical protein ORPV_884 [Orpheovirus IHUMI-LCC2]|uniref:Uncharacterized protein n=1 Tax=Orpheovirus IHUMI-LCC2 TaxID=2023057 RepID=A0A2I2L5G3_9VIRU|nr:Hypothetical protein ORPV_884 [Orpheovirus IHUMI-LCC2]SNW62788.1 Hypothetical protein ORPV_884 [Orpheovirus IHUMI-LCC2]